jgi:hypothetical protein
MLARMLYGFWGIRLIPCFTATAQLWPAYGAGGNRVSNKNHMALAGECFGYQGQFGNSGFTSLAALGFDSLLSQKPDRGNRRY